MATTPWKPARVLDIPAELKDKRFTYRWASKRSVGRIQKLIAEGWEIDKEISSKLEGSLPSTMEDGSSLDGTVQRRELVVMRLPREMADARNAYYQKRAGETVASAEDQLKKSGLSYGKMTTTVTKGVGLKKKQEEVADGE